MGCFNVSCAASGISMYDDDVAFIPLVPNRMWNRETKDTGALRFDSAHIVSNEGCQTLFNPVTLPIFGSLNSYGTLQDIERDFNTQAIEEHYKISIEDFTERAIRENYTEKRKIEKFLTGTYIHRDIYDLLIQPLKDEWGGTDEYTKLYEAQIQNAVYAYKKYREQLTDLETRAKEAKNQTVLDVLKELNRLDMGDKTRELRLADFEHNHFRELYKDAIESEEIVKPLAAFGRLRHNMFAINRLLMPTFNGYQHGNYYAERELHKKALEIVKRKIKQGE